MVSLQRKEQIARSLRQLTEIYRSNLAEYEQTLATLSALLDLETPPVISRIVLLEQAPAHVFADPMTFCAVLGNRRCYLGNTLVFGLFSLLVSRLNRYVSYSELLSEVWKQEEKSPEAVRTVVQILRKKLRAAAMSTEHQQYSTENQRDAIREYAERRGYEIIATYADEGKSGLRMEGRDALGRLLADVQSGSADFTAILVYDVSRWGRFQDADESAYYEYSCTQSSKAKKARDYGVRILPDAVFWRLAGIGVD